MRKLLMIGALLIVLLVQPLASAETPTNSVVYKIEQTYRLPNDSSTVANNVIATIFLFDNRTDYANQEIRSELLEVDDVPASPPITRTEDNRVASFSLGTIVPGSSKTITYTSTIKVTQVGPIDPDEVQGSVPSGLLAYTQPVADLWESDDPVLQSKALDLTQNQPNLYYKAKAIFDFVKSHLSYQEMTAEHSALWAYNSHLGDCSEFTHLFSALCRAASIPTRFVSGYGYDAAKDENLAKMGHAFAFIYLPGVEWVLADLTWGSGGQFGKLGNDHLIQLTSDGGNLVSGGVIEIPSNNVRYSYSGQDPDINFDSTETIVREVAVDLQLSSAQSMQGNIKKFYVTAKNEGTKTVTNLNVELIADNLYFEVPGAQSISGLNPGQNQMVTFDVRVKGSVENSAVTARVTYDSPYGTFLAEGLNSINVTVRVPSGEAFNIMLLALIGVVIGLVIVGVAIVLLRR